MQVSYITSAAKAQQLPHPDGPEVAVVGRSNCGKSSLINALTGHKSIARTSRTPGRTQMANFFSINQRGYLVDLPGYGFSQGTAASRPHWQELVETYLNRPNILRILFLMDIRRKLDKDDLEIIQFIVERQSLLVVLTKADKLSRQAQMASEKNLSKQLSQIFPQNIQVMRSSTLKKTGLEELKAVALSDFVKNS